MNCLGCQNEIAIWDNGCGACGAQQTPLVDKALANLKKLHDQAESLLTDLDFKAAADEVALLASETDSRLQQYEEWCEEFTKRLEQIRQTEHSRLIDQLREAIAHENACDYKSGLQTLTQVAPALKQTSVSENEDTAEEIAKRLTTKQSRLKELEGIVRERVGKREITGLLPIVNELLTLKPDRPEVQKLKEQLEKRDTDLFEVRDAAINKATQQLGEQQYAEAVATLNTVSEEVSSEQLEELKTKASDLLNQLNNLRDRITTAVDGNQLKGLLPVIEECLTLKADQRELVKLRQELIDREAQTDARNQQIIAKAKQMMHELQFNEAVQILEKISQDHQTSTTVELSQLVRQLSAQRQGILSAESSDLSKKGYETTIKKIGNYLSKIAKVGIRDPQLQQMLKDTKNRASSSNPKQKVDQSWYCCGICSDDCRGWLHCETIHACVSDQQGSVDWGLSGGSST